MLQIQIILKISIRYQEHIKVILQYVQYCVTPLGPHTFFFLGLPLPLSFNFTAPLFFFLFLTLSCMNYDNLDQDFISIFIHL